MKKYLLLLPLAIGANFVHAEESYLLGGLGGIDLMSDSNNNLSYNIIAGHELNDFISIEGSFLYSHDSKKTSNIKLSGDMYALTLTPTIYFEPASNFRILAKGGAAYYYVNADIKLPDSVDSDKVHDSNSVFAGALGVAAQYQYPLNNHNNFIARIGYDYYFPNGSDYSNFDHIICSVGFSF
ncbi:outer membrane beta-barrel protein [Photobacterium damselae]|uniref:outer membrane beta-barrel protein n=1 Tax=Photobacterium damselae TaxID=38293 RepID=UPI0040698D31